MAVKNRDIVQILNEIGDLIDIQGSNQFRVRAYRSAARTVGDLDEEIEDLLADGIDLSSLPDIGEGIAEKLQEFVETGTLRQLDELRKEIDPRVTELLELENLGPARAGTLYRELGIVTPEDLIQAAKDDKIAQLEGFGEKTQEQLRDEAERYRENGARGRTRLGEVDEIVFPLVEYLNGLDATSAVRVAGSYRRRKEDVGDIDIVAVCDDSKAAMDAFASYERADSVISKGETRSSIVLTSGIQVDLRAVEEAAFGAALYYFTGSKEHNVAVRRRAQERDLKMNEYGVFRGDDRVAGADEESVFAAVSLQFIEPELRENRGEIEAAERDELPQLITIDDIRGDLHMHTPATDGKNTIAELAAAAKELGLEYIAITDHSKRVSMANGLTADGLLDHVDQIDEANEKAEVYILKGIEVDILEDGTLDLPNDVLDRLDVVVASVHYGRNMSEKQMTNRFLTAIDNPVVSVLGHPTGRLIGRREPYDVDLSHVFRHAAEAGVALELNADPERLDLSDVQCRSAIEHGAKLVISTDAHSTGGLAHMRYGVDTARRGWVEAGDVVNTRPRTEVQKLLKR
ncbi:MAG: DNA polymerase/3'-5' exonuclease PolX [Spirochaetota bacterium]